MTEPGRVMALDVGTKRIGVAVSDPTGTLATPLETLTRRAGKRPPLAKLEAIGREMDARHLVVGLPIGLDGHENEWCTEVRGVGDALAARLGVDVSYVDERLTSVRAERTVRSLGLTRKERERKERVDAIAAQLILQAWLDRPEGAR